MVYKERYCHLNVIALLYFCILDFHEQSFSHLVLSSCFLFFFFHYPFFYLLFSFFPVNEDLFLILDFVFEFVRRSFPFLSFSFCSFQEPIM